MLFWAYFLIADKFLKNLVLFVAFFMWVSYAFGNDLTQQYQKGRLKAEETYRSFYNTVNDPKKLTEFWMNPLVGKGTLKTVNGTPVGGNTTIVCAGGGRKVLELNVLPMGSGDLKVYVTWNVTGNDSKQTYFEMVSAPCANGLIICNHPDAFANCKYYLVEYDDKTDRFYLTDSMEVNGKKVPVTYKELASPCVCVKNVCGAGVRNSFAANPGYILQLLGGAFVSALQAKRPDFVLTSSEIEGYSIRYYGQSQKDCIGLEDAAYVKELTSYKDNADSLKMKAEDMYFSLRTVPNHPASSVYSLYEVVKDNMTNFNLYTCTKKYVVIPQTYSISDLKVTASSQMCGTYDAFFTAVDERTIQVKLNVMQLGETSFTFDLFPDLLSKLSKVEVRFCTIAKARAACFDDDVCVVTTINGYSVQGCGRNRDKRRDFVLEIPVSVLRLNNTGHVRVYFSGGGNVPKWCPPLYIVFYFNSPLDFCYVKSEYIEDNCQSYENDPKCVLYEEFYMMPKNPEKIPLVVSGIRTGYKPLEYCTMICPSLEVCRDDWIFERKYRCKQDPVDFSDLVKRQEHVKSTLGLSGNTVITFEDIRKEKGSWKVFGNNQIYLPFESEIEDCMYVCKVSRLHTTREVEQDMSVRGYDKPREREFVYKLCSKGESGNYVCPLQEGEKLETDCSCDSAFNDAIIALQALRQAAMDFICAEKK